MPAFWLSYFASLGYIRHMSATEGTILAVDDEASIRRFLKAYLEGQGYTLAEATAGRQALALAAAHPPLLILLDLGLPDMDGLEVLAQLREWCSAPVIVLSARGQEEDKIAALDGGAVDYLTKPFSVGELAARIRGALRRAASAHEPTQPVIVSGALSVDLARQQVHVEGAEVRLTPIEFKLLAYLAKNAGKVLTHNQILREVWGRVSEEQAHYARVYVHQLRQKLEADPARPRYLRTETGVGYRFIPQGESDAERREKEQP